MCHNKQHVVKIQKSSKTVIQYRITYLNCFVLGEQYVIYVMSIQFYQVGLNVSLDMFLCNIEYAYLQ